MADSEILSTTQTIAQMAATIYANEMAACITVWQRGSDRDGPDEAECVSAAVSLYALTEKYIATNGTTPGAIVR